MPLNNDDFEDDYDGGSLDPHLRAVFWRWAIAGLVLFWGAVGLALDRWVF